MDLKTFLDEQRKQQQRLHVTRHNGEFDGDWQGRLAAELAAQARHYQVACTGDLFDSQKVRPRDERIHELIDVFKFWLCLAVGEGMNEAEIESLFAQKTYVVDNRQSFPDKARLNKVAFVDLDGVLAQKGSWLPNDEEFTRAGRTLTIPPMPGAHAFLTGLRDLNFEIAVVTSRKVKEVARLEYDTYSWLVRTNLPHDKVLFGYDKTAAAKTFLRGDETHIITVEDSVKHAIDYANEGWDTYLLDPKLPPAPHGGVTVVGDFDFILAIASLLE